MATKKLSRKEELAKYREAINHEKLRHTRVDPTGAHSQGVEVISTGSSILDQVIGIGGVPRGRVTEIYGDESVGKTTLATHIVASIQQMIPDSFSLYLDFEHAFAPDYAEQGIGVNLNPDHFDWHQPETFEQGQALCHMALSSVKPDVIVLDSVAAMTPKKEFEADPDTPPEKFMGLKARLLSSWLQKLTKQANQANTAIILINQMRARIKQGPFDYGPDKDTTGGNAIKFYASLRVNLKKGATEYAMVENPMLGKKEKTPVSNFVRVTIDKNKVGGTTKRQGIFCIRYGVGIDNIRSIIDVAIAHSIIKKSGAWYSYGNEGDPNHFKRNGIELVRTYLEDHEEVFLELLQRVRNILDDYQIKKADQAYSDDELVRQEADEPFDSDTGSVLDESEDDEIDADELMPQATVETKKEAAPEKAADDEPEPTDDLLDDATIKGVLGL